MVPLSVPPAVTVLVAQAAKSEKATPLAELFALTKSAVVAVTLALFVYPPGAPGITATVTVALEPTPSAPKLQVIVVVPLHEPWLGVEETQVRPAASVSVKVTPELAAGPLLVTVMV
jgi:hypothetical protein